MSAFRIARQIHESQRRLAVAYPSPPPEALLAWEELPADGRRLTVAVVADLLERGVVTPGGLDFGPNYSNPDTGVV